MGRVRHLALTGLGGVLLLSACTATPTASPSAATSAVAPSGPTRAPEPAPSGAPTPQEAAPPCSAATLAGVEATVAAQLEAFAARDFRTAFGLASESFRSGVDLPTFRRLIRQDYPEVADAAAHLVVECADYGPSAAAARVDVTGANGRTVQLAYRFVLEPDGWHVDGASTLGRLTTDVV